MEIYKTYCGEIDAVFHDVTFDVAESSIQRCGTLTLAVFPRPGGEGQRQTSVLLAAGLVVPADLQFLPWGLVRADTDELVAVGRTNEAGQFLVAVSEGKYRVRYVCEARTELDRRILFRLGDAEALGMMDAMDAAACDDSLLRRAAPAIGWRLDAGQPAYQAKAHPMDFAARQPMSGCLRRHQNQLWVVTAVDDVPFGIVCVAATKGGKTVASRLLAMPIVERGEQRARENSVDVRQLVGYEDPELFAYDAWPVSQDPQTRQLATVNEIKHFAGELDRSQSAPEVVKEIHTLIGLLENQP